MAASANVGASSIEEVSTSEQREAKRGRSSSAAGLCKVCPSFDSSFFCRRLPFSVLTVKFTGLLFDLLVAYCIIYTYLLCNPELIPDHAVITVKQRVIGPLNFCLFPECASSLIFGASSPQTPLQSKSHSASNQPL